MNIRLFCDSVWGRDGSDTFHRAWEVYKKSQHALWMARALRAKEAQSEKSFNNYLFKHKTAWLRLKGISNWIAMWKWVEHKCLKKAKQFE